MYEDPVPTGGLPTVSAYQFIELLKDVKTNIDGFVYDVSLNVIGGSAKSTTTTDVKRIESCPNAVSYTHLTLPTIRSV